jgi:hypothetical protein
VEQGNDEREGVKLQQGGCTQSTPGLGSASSFGSNDSDDAGPGTVSDGDDPIDGPEDAAEGASGGSQCGAEVCIVA